MDLIGQLLDRATLSVTLSEGRNTPPVGDTGSDQTVTKEAGQGTLVALDGTQSFDPDGAVVGCDGNENGTRITCGASVAIRFGVSTHGATPSVTDDQGQVGSDSLVVEVTEGGVPAPGGLRETVVGGVVTLAWSDNEGGFYIIQRGC